MATPVGSSGGQVKFVENSIHKKAKKYSTGTIGPAEAKAMLAGMVVKTEKGHKTPLKITTSLSVANPLLSVQSPKPKDEPAH